MSTVAANKHTIVLGFGKRIIRIRAQQMKQVFLVFNTVNVNYLKEIIDHIAEDKLTYFWGNDCNAIIIKPLHNYYLECKTINR